MDLPGRGGLRGRVGGAGPGEQRGGPGQLTFESLRRQFDKNKDGRIEKSEVAPALHRRFEELDRNKDGTLTDDDFPGKNGDS
jgi:Ca2+-binding EF-hand superfamily protein